MTATAGQKAEPAVVDARTLGLTVLVSGSIVSLASIAGLALLAEAEGIAPLQPLNATSHWLNGDGAAARRGVDLRHTVVGVATHHVSCLFWALPFAAWQTTRPARTGAELLRDAVAMATVAAVVDYRATPQRFTPGWELVLSKSAMAAAYGALALGFVAGTVASRRILPPKSRQVAPHSVQMPVI